MFPFSFKLNGLVGTGSRSTAFKELSASLFFLGRNDLAETDNKLGRNGSWAETTCTRNKLTTYLHRNKLTSYLHRNKLTSYLLKVGTFMITIIVIAVKERLEYDFIIIPETLVITSVVCGEVKKRMVVVE